jgi:ankyrin repeat protein
MSHAQSGFEALAAAVRANDARILSEVLARFPELQGHLDEALPGSAFGATALLEAVHHDNRDVVDALLNGGANINQRSHWWAGSFGVLDHDGSLTDFLIERGAVVDAHAAARLGRIDVLRELLARDPALVHARGGDGQRPLHFASSIEVAQLLLDHGAEIDAIDVDHESTATQWMVRDRQDVARYLVSRGGRTDILMAAALGDYATVEAHLARDPSAVRTIVSEEYFPKHDPRSGGTIYTWTLGGGKGPHALAREFGHDQIFRMLMECSPAELQLSVWAEQGDSDEIRALLARDPSVVHRLTAADIRKLPDAARDENAAAVRVMLEAGWPIAAGGQHAATALHWAAFHGNLEITRELLRQDAPLELRDTDFDGTPLSWGIYGSTHGWRAATGNYPAVVEALLDAGATPPTVTDDLPASEAVREVLLRRRL